MDSTGLYTVERITADVVLYQTASLDTKVCTNNQQGAIQQSSSIRYRIGTSQSESTIYKSGNPGYRLGYPLLVADSETSSG